MLRILTAGESHGKYLTAIIEGLPSGLCIKSGEINKDLARRQIGYGAGKRMQIEKDEAEITSGVRFGKTIGSPVTLLIRNLDWINWEGKMSAHAIQGASNDIISKPRPGHTDLPGALKYNHKDIRNVLERSSARETTTRVAIGSLCRAFLNSFNIRVYSFVSEIGGIRIKNKQGCLFKLSQIAEQSILRLPCKPTEKKVLRMIDAIKAKGDSLGGIFQVIADGVPPGLGSYSQWDLRLDGRLSKAFMSIQAVKGVEIGLGFDAALQTGSKVHDEIYYSKTKGFFRKTNNAGGIEGGITNGEPIVIRAAMKPIATLYSPLRSVDILSKKTVKAAIERSDICRVPSAAVIGEAMLCIELAKSMLEKFGGDSMQETINNFNGYKKYLENY